MSRPLLITDCDEVLLYMMTHFRDWLAEEEGVVCDLSQAEFYRSLRRAGSDAPLEQAEMWALLNAFFDRQMHRQTPVEGAVEAIAAIQEHADVVVLTNLLDFRRDARRQQLAGHGMDLRVFTNQGPKGPALRAIVEEYGPSRAVFIDDLSQHHGSVFEVAPQVRRLHLCAEPLLAPHIPCAHAAGHAHARIDGWDTALPWVLEALVDDEPILPETGRGTAREAGGGGDSRPDAAPRQDATPLRQPCGLPPSRAGEDRIPHSDNQGQQDHD